MNYLAKLPTAQMIESGGTHHFDQCYSGDLDCVKVLRTALVSASAILAVSEG